MHSMIRWRLWSRSLSRESSFCARLVKVPVILFFLLSIIVQTATQLKMAFRMDNRVLNYSPNPSFGNSTNIHPSPFVPQSQSKLEGQRTNITDNKNNISQSRLTVSSKNTLEQNKSILYFYSNTIQKNGGQQKHQEKSNENLTLPSIDDGKVTTVSDEIIVSMKNKNVTIRTEEDLHELKKKKEKNLLSLTEEEKVATLRKPRRETRVIFGIMSYDSDTERKRRGLIRSTFLRYFTKYMNRTLVKQYEYNEMRHWICSLNDLDHGKLEYPEKCRFAYAFVQGANPNGSSMLLSFNETYPISVPPPTSKKKQDLKDASDTIYLNIKENGKFGKTPTWFRYAIDVLERHDWIDDWDYIFKSDTDNLIYTPRFFRFMDKLPQKNAIRIYGGFPLDYRKCGGDKHDHCAQMKGPYFMQGGCYFLSTDLARFISDETTFDHQAVKLPHEDMTTGNFVYSHPLKIKVVTEPKKKNVIRKHPVKKESSFKFRWQKMLREEELRLSKHFDLQ